MIATAKSKMNNPTRDFEGDPWYFEYAPVPHGGVERVCSSLLSDELNHISHRIGINTDSAKWLSFPSSDGHAKKLTKTRKRNDLHDTLHNIAVHIA